MVLYRAYRDRLIEALKMQFFSYLISSTALDLPALLFNLSRSAKSNKHSEENNVRTSNRPQGQGLIFKSFVETLDHPSMTIRWAFELELAWQLEVLQDFLPWVLSAPVVA